RFGLDLVGLEHAARTKVRKFSVGMKQRLGIAQAIMEKPKLLLLDEPTSGLDADGVAMLHDLVKRLKAEGVTILLTSHIREDITALSDRVLEMESGVLKALDPAPI
ncbi:ATP-binding cassette domain-containing protein, partial [Calditerricola satsumensis]